MTSYLVDELQFHYPIPESPLQLRMFMSENGKAILRSIPRGVYRKDAMVENSYLKFVPKRNRVKPYIKKEKKEMSMVTDDKL